MVPQIDDSVLRSLSVYLSHRHIQQYRVPIPFPLARLPVELRLKIYEYAFAWPIQTIHLDKLSEWQSWAYEPSLCLGDCTFYPHGLKRIPDVQDEALAEAYQKTVFKATQLDQIVRLYGSLGRIGIANLQTLHLDWAATEHPDFADLTALEYHDSLVIHVVSLLRHLKRLRHLSIQLNGYAFVLAYVNARHRRIGQPDISFTESTKLSYNIGDYHNNLGQVVRLADIPVATVHEIPGQVTVWKTSRYKFVAGLHFEVAQCDPMFQALASIRGLTTFELKQSAKFPGGLGLRIEEWLRSEVTKPKAEEEEEEMDDY